MERFTYQRAAEGGFPCQHGWEVVDTSDGEVVCLATTQVEASAEARALNEEEEESD
ncbi:hypothetical protein LCGC14_0288460 [marine sediment metagenome]|uniref:Uncharacterized protein n=1 Tax=marine sediment metagenome TaxID=412755 RepID=A0A0F9TYL1_9ZZZZ